MKVLILFQLDCNEVSSEFSFFFYMRVICFLFVHVLIPALIIKMCVRVVYWVWTTDYRIWETK